MKKKSIGKTLGMLSLLSGLTPVYLMAQGEETDAFQTHDIRQVKDSLKKLRTTFYWAGTNVYSVGVQLGVGAGFNGVTMVTLENGGEATISAGGGFHLMANAAYRFAKNIDIQAEGGVQSAFLTPTVNNATVTFTRFVFGATCRYSVPFGNRFRVNAGPGISFFRKPTLDAQLEKLPDGAHYKFFYKPSMGYNGSAEVEFFFRSLSAVMGLKYYTCHYDIESATMDGYPVLMSSSGLDDFRRMDGSGLFFHAGIGIHL